MKNNEIKEWLSFNDNEIGMLQNFVIEYVKENDIDKEKAFILGVLSSQFQYYMRCMKELIHSNETKYINDVSVFIKSMKETSKNNETAQLGIGAVSSRFVNVKLRRDTAEAMISTYEFLVWNNVGEDKKECQRILKALKKALS